MTISRSLLSIHVCVILLTFAGTAKADWWQECAAERDRFCKDLPAGGGRIANCIDAHSADLSARCLASRPASNQRNAPVSSPSPAQPRANDGMNSSNGFRSIYQTGFQTGIDNGLMLQQPNANSIQIAQSPCSPNRNSLRVAMRRQDDYSRVANGVPRAEVNFFGRFTFQMRQEYRVNWSTCLPPDFQFDSQQPEGITQIHSGQPQGSPPFGLTLVGARYEAQLRNGSHTQTFNIGSANSDRGRWVHWTLHYRPDSSGTNAISELEKDGAIVMSANGQPNAYPNDSRGYLKVGIYKWWWKDRPSDVTERTMYFGDIVVEGR
ncbi:MAG: heparin lyase I family protein [Burkholderiaceae bacterium]